jgi:hypothetical protein
MGVDMSSVVSLFINLYSKQIRILTIVNVLVWVAEQEWCMKQKKKKCQLQVIW